VSRRRTTAAGRQEVSTAPCASEHRNGVTRPVSVTVSGPPAQPPAHPLPAASSPGKSRGPPGGHMRMHARRDGKRQARAPPGTGTGTPSSGYPHRSLAPIPVRHTSVNPATQRPTALLGDTPRDRGETPRQHENSQLAGRFRRVWQVMGSNQRRLSRRFYSPSLLPESPPMTSAHALRGGNSGRGGRPRWRASRSSATAIPPRAAGRKGGGRAATGTGLDVNDQRVRELRAAGRVRTPASRPGEPQRIRAARAEGSGGWAVPPEISWLTSWRGV
jgi:hypothetical protein